MWSDMVGYYKQASFDFYSRLCVFLEGEPAVDTGVRRQVYTTVFDHFLNNHCIRRLLDGPVNHVRPVYSAEVR